MPCPPRNACTVLLTLVVSGIPCDALGRSEKANDTTPVLYKRVAALACSGPEMGKLTWVS